MKILVLMLHIGAFLAGLYDNGDMTFFETLILFDVCILLGKVFGPSTMLDRISDYIKK